MNNGIWIIVAAASATILTRLVVLWLPNTWKQSRFLEYVSLYLPVMSFGLLVVYSLKGVQVGNYPFGIPEWIGVLMIAVLQIWKDKLLVSIFVSSFVYIILVNFVF